MARTGENIYKRKDGRWEGRYIRERVNGKAKYRSVYASTYRQVKEKLDAAKKAPKPNAFNKEKNGTVTELGYSWLEEAAVSLKESSVNKYEDLLRCYILPEFGENELSAITNQQLIRFANQLLSSGGAKKQGLAPATVTEILSAMNGIRIYAMKKEYAVAFSTDCVSIKKEQRKIRVLSLEEEKCLLQYLQENMDCQAMGVLLCLFTGIRIGELCAMKWDDVDLSEKKMSVSKTMQRMRAASGTGKRTEIRILEPKSACSARVIPIPDAITGVLEKFYRPGTFLLTGNESHFVEPRTMQNYFKKVIADCGIRNANFHATRHTFATRCIELGFDVKSLSEILGHASVAITMNRYVHPSMALKQENMNRFSDLFTVK